MHVLLSCVGHAAKEAVAWEVDDTRGLFRVLSKNGRSSNVRTSEEEGDGGGGTEWRRKSGSRRSHGGGRSQGDVGCRVQLQLQEEYCSHCEEIVNTL